MKYKSLTSLWVYPSDIIEGWSEEEAKECDLEELVEKKEVVEAIEELKDKIRYEEGVAKRWFDRCMEARRLWVRNTRSLWLTRAERAREKWLSMIMHSGIYGDLIEKWKNVESKCRAKAERYK